MLSERMLAAVCMLCAVCGIAVLLYANTALAPPKTGIAEIGRSRVGDRVSVSGRIDWVLKQEGFSLFTLDDGKKIKVVRFSPSPEENGLLEKGAMTTVFGKVQLYKNELEIVAEEIRPWLN